jgi:hypothetical protein
MSPSSTAASIRARMIVFRAARKPSFSFVVAMPRFDATVDARLSRYARSRLSATSSFRSDASFDSRSPSSTAASTCAPADLTIAALRAVFVTPSSFAAVFTSLVVLVPRSPGPR